MVRDVRDTRTESEGAADDVAAPDTSDYEAVVRAMLANDPMTPEERARRMREGLERLREMHKRILAEIGTPLPDGWAARMVREGRP